MALASMQKVVSGSAAFLLFWILAVFPSFPVLPLGRTAGAVMAAVAMVVLQVETPEEAWGAVDLSVLTLLFGTMVVGAYLEQADMFTYVGRLLSWRSRGGKDLLCRVCVLTAISSALFTNDTACLVLTGLVVRVCEEKGLAPLPFLIALATSANIGSVATPIGNPQNLIIAVQSGLSFAHFILRLLPPMLLALSLNTLFLLLFYWRHLSPSSVSASSVDQNLLPISDADDHRVEASLQKKNASPWTPFRSGTNITLSDFDLLRAVRSEANLGISNVNALGGGGDDSRLLSPSPAAAASFADALQAPLLRTQQRELGARRMSELESIILSKIDSSRSLSAMMGGGGGGKWKEVVRKCAVYSVAAGMLVALLCGLDMSWTALTTAVCLMVIDFSDAGPNLEKVSYPLLVFFSGMFIAVDGFNSTGIPSVIWDLVEPHARVTDAAGTIVLTLVIILLSNVASNVPTVLLLGWRVSASAGGAASAERAWMILAWASTLGGNLTLGGSAANLIVSEQAMKAHTAASSSKSVDLKFLSHLKFGLPSTLLLATAGLPFIK